MRHLMNTSGATLLAIFAVLATGLLWFIAGWALVFVLVVAEGPFEKMLPSWFPSTLKNVRGLLGMSERDAT